MPARPPPPSRQTPQRVRLRDPGIPRGEPGRNPRGARKAVLQFAVRAGPIAKEDEDRAKAGTKTGHGSNFKCVLTYTPITPQHIKAEGVAGRMGSHMMAIVTEGVGGRCFLSPMPEHEAIAQFAEPEWEPDFETSRHPQYMGAVGYSIGNFKELFTRPSTVRADDVQRSRYGSVREGTCRRPRGRAARCWRHRGDFSGVHIVPDGSGEGGDEMEARLVILGPEHPYARNDGVRAVEAAENILNTHGSTQRIYRNALAFLAPDQQRLPELRQAVRLWMAWSFIADEHEHLNLDASQRKQAESKRGEFEKTVATRILET